MTLPSDGARKLIQFLFEIKKRPFLYLEKKSLRQLSAIQIGFIFGYNNICEYDIHEFYEKTKHGNIWTQFQQYLSEKYNICSMDDSELIYICKSDEKAFDLFFEELETFLKDKNIEIPK